MPPPCAVESHVPCYLLQDYAISSKREPPRAKPVASKETSSDLFRSHHRETPPDKPVSSLSVFTQSLPRSATDLLLITFTHTLSLEIHLGGHFGKFPYLGPSNSPIPIFSARKPIEHQLAKIASLSSQHKLPREGLRRCKETETGISNDADAFKGHQRSHYVSEICGKAKRIFVHHFCEIIGQLFEID